MVYRDPIEITGVKKIIEVEKMFNIPMSPSERILMKKRSAMKDMALFQKPASVYTPTLLVESRFNIFWILEIKVWKKVAKKLKIESAFLKFCDAI
ncbi:MAG: hypothetical protein J5I50_07000 [Chitinophagaceae bacterium]|nr:hypothetical protein [Chitinophagaceae bacterium]